MARRFVSIWFRHLMTDWFTLRQDAINRGSGETTPSFRDQPFVLRAPSHGRMMITAANAHAQQHGIDKGWILADARAVVPGLQVRDDIPGLAEKILKKLAEWCIRFTPIAAVDLPDGIILDATGCSHLWGGDLPYLRDITKKLNSRGYNVRASIADTPGAAWAVARFGKDSIIQTGKVKEAILPLPPQSLRLDPEAVERLHKLGLHEVRQFLSMPRASLRRRFGPHFLLRLDMVVGNLDEKIEPVQQPEPYQERLPCMDPIVTANGIHIALEQLLTTLSARLKNEQKGLRAASFKGYRVDGKIEEVTIITNRPSHNVIHLLKLFEIKLPTIQPALGIELFTLEATKVEDHLPYQEKMWQGSGGGLDDMRLSELLDRLAGKAGMKAISRYLPDEHYWPERSIKPASSIQEKSTTAWSTNKLRPLKLLRKPEAIDVTAPIPDYPPMLFRHKGKLHKIVKADGPERIEQEWWIQQGQHRDYYRVEDEDGNRYWLFRAGHYHDSDYRWYLHGYFA